MNDEFAGTGRITGEAFGNNDRPVGGRHDQTARRARREVVQAQGAACQFSGGVRAWPLTSAAIAVGAGSPFGRRR